jgi:hypothetical protein
MVIWGRSGQGIPEHLSSLSTLIKGDVMLLWSGESRSDEYTMTDKIAQSQHGSETQASVCSLLAACSYLARPAKRIVGEIRHCRFPAPLSSLSVPSPSLVDAQLRGASWAARPPTPLRLSQLYCAQSQRRSQVVHCQRDDRAWLVMCARVLTCVWSFRRLVELSQGISRLIPIRVLTLPTAWLFSQTLSRDLHPPRPGWHLIRRRC